MEDVCGGKIIGSKLNITKALSTLLLEHNKYIANLSVWNEYIIWNYTLGSQPVNRTLLGMQMSARSINAWTFDLFNNFKQYGHENIGKPFKKWREFFDNPSSFYELNHGEQNDLSSQALRLYTLNLQAIIMNAPVTKGDITVYKASTPYDQRLVEVAYNGFPFELYQPPFNSTTYDPWFDFNAFLGSNNDSCCLWEIVIPAGSRCLAIVHPYQAYLTEREIILPYGSTFSVTGARGVEMSYYADREAPQRTQAKGVSMIGEVYRHDNWESRVILQRPMRMLEAIYIQP